MVQRLSPSVYVFTLRGNVQCDQRQTCHFAPRNPRMARNESQGAWGEPSYHTQLLYTGHLPAARRYKLLHGMLSQWDFLQSMSPTISAPASTATSPRPRTTESRRLNDLAMWVTVKFHRQTEGTAGETYTKYANQAGIHQYIRLALDQH